MLSSNLVIITVQHFCWFVWVISYLPYTWAATTTEIDLLFLRIWLYYRIHNTILAAAIDNNPQKNRNSNNSDPKRWNITSYLQWFAASSSSTGLFKLTATCNQFNANKYDQNKIMYSVRQLILQRFKFMKFGTAQQQHQMMAIIFLEIRKSLSSNQQRKFEDSRKISR